MNPGYRTTQNLLHDIAPEIKRAIEEIYKPTQPYINTKTICRYILENKQDYPILSKRIDRVITQFITLALKEQGLKLYTSEKHSHKHGRTFIRVLPSSKN